MRGAGALLALIAVMACQWDRQYDSPYIPGTKDYAGDDWTHDGDGDGIADSVEKYMPGCPQSPGLCLRDARILRETPPDRFGLRAEDLFLWSSDGPKMPDLTWSPPEAAWRGHSLASSDTDIVALRGDTLVPKAAGQCRINVVSPGPVVLRTEFRVRVATLGVRVKSIRASDMVLRPNADTLPPLEWDPPDATYKDYSLAVEPESVAVASGDGIRGLRPGRAKAVVTAADGKSRAEFSILVAAAPIRTVLTAAPLLLAVGDSAASPILTWDPPDAAQAGYHLSLPDTSAILALSEDGRKLIPLSAGTARVRAVSADGQAQADFQVTVAAARVPVTGLKAEDLLMRMNDAPRAPVLNWLPADATDRRYTLSTRDSAVAVPFDDKIKPVHPGKAIFTVTARDGGLTADFQVKVEGDSASDPKPDPKPNPDSIPVPVIVVASIQVPDFSLDLKDPPYSPVVAFTPADAADKSYALIATEADGAIRIEANKVLPVRAGKSPLRVVPNGNPAAAAVCTVTVTARAHALSVKNDTLAPDGDRPSLAGRMTWDPPEATDQSYRLISLAPAIVGVSPGDSGYHAVAPGTAKLIATAQDGSGAADTFTVLVRIPVTQIIAKDLTMKVGDPVFNPWSIIAFVPDNASNKGWSFDYLGPDSALTQKVVGIVNHWELQAAGVGTARLAAYALDNRAIRDTFTVTVVKPVQSLAADTSAPISLRVGGPDVAPNVSVVPADAGIRTWHLVSANPAIVSVAGTTALRAVMPGITSVTVISDDNPQITISLKAWVRIGP